MLCKMTILKINNNRFNFTEIKTFNDVKSLYIFKGRLNIETRLDIFKVRLDNVLDLKVYE